MTDLLPCPFCGGIAQAMRNGARRWVECEGCHAEGPGMNTMESALAGWNRRIDPLGLVQQQIEKRKDRVKE